MNYLFLIFFTVAVILYGIISKRKVLFKSLNKKTKKNDELTDFDEKFFRNSKNRTAIEFVRTFNPSDLIIIRSLLDSLEIETLIRFNSMGGLLPGIEIMGHTNSIICIYEDKADEAIVLLENYITALKNQKKEKMKGLLRNIAEFAIGGYAIPSGRNKGFPELLVKNDN